MSAILRIGVVKIRKPHTCWGCASKYEKGTLMTVTVDTQNGIESVYWCDTCTEYMRQHYDDGDDCGFGEVFRNDPDEWKRIHNELKEGSEVKQ